MTCEDQLGRYKVLIDTAHCFGRAMDLKTLIDNILNRSQEVVRAEACSLLLPDAQTKELILYSTDPRIATLPQPLRVPPGAGIAGAVYQSKQKVTVNDAQNDPRHYRSIGQQVGFVTHAMLAIPLLDGMDCLGVMQALNPRDRDFFDEQDEEIFEGFGGLVAIALRRLESERQKIELVRSAQELQVAREIQESFLPLPTQKFPFAQVHMNYFPASAVGGDFCCVHGIGAHRLLLGLGDVTGKGIPAALTMARATAMIKATIDQIGTDLGGWVTALNRRLVEDLQAGRFIGMTFLLADAVESTLQVCAAGQFPPLHFNGQRWANFELQNCLPLGISPEITYRAVTTPLRPGDSWLLFSDGIPEARNRAGEDFTMPRFLESLPLGQTVVMTLAAAVSAWKEFVHSAPQHDDASLLLLDWRGQAPPADFQTLCCEENLAAGREFVEKWAAFSGYDDVTIGQIVLACDEATTNVLRHGYDKTPGPLSYRAGVDDAWLTIQIVDDAKPVDLSKLQSRKLSDLRPGGLGTFIMTQVFDEVKYEPLTVGTSLTLRKKLP
jgi:sigma-B regulation protein RsbU (phosphoserine phosphatase)